MMKICMLAPEFPPVWGGVGTYIVELVRHLPRNMEIHVVTPKREGFGKEKISSSDQDFSEYFGSNVTVHFICKASDTFFYNARFQYACFKYVPKLVKEENIDLIHSHTAQMPDLLLMFRKVAKPVVTTIHTTIESQWYSNRICGQNVGDFERSEKATYFLYPVLRLAEKAYLKRRGLCITPSNWMKQRLESGSGVNAAIRVIPNSVDINDYGSKKCYSASEYLIPKELRNRKIVLYAGRLLAMKGVDTLIEAIPAIVKEVKERNPVFVFAGPGNPNRYVRRVKEMKIEPSCLFVGALPREVTIQLMKAAELVVVPSFSENCPYSVLESMACGTPVVASNVGGVPEIIRDKFNGILIEPGFPQMLANSVVDLLDDTSLGNSLGQHAKETIRDNFSWSANLMKYLESYHEASVLTYAK
jgi:glycosyltransferase involved in cell wall biosynthesis